MSDVSIAPAGTFAVLIAIFQKRAKLHFLLSYAIILAILLLFALAGYIFFKAQDIDQSRGAVDLVRELQIVLQSQEQVAKATQKEFETTQRRFRTGQATIPEYLEAAKLFADADKHLLFLREKERLMNQVGYYSDIESIKSREELSTQLTGQVKYEERLKADRQWLEERNSKATQPLVSTERFDRVLSELAARRELLEERIRVAPLAATIKRTASNIDAMELLRTSLVRFGGMAVILFLISILVPIYRYNVRLATYYLARADTLRFSGEFKIEDFSTLTKLLTPTHAFEKEPSTPIDSLSAFAKEVLGLVKKT